MADTQYDLPEKVVKLYRMKEEMRKKSKAYFAKYMSNPYREGLPYDAQNMRFTAAKAYRYEFYKRTPLSITFSFCALFLPIALHVAYIYYTLKTTDEKCRSGEIAYKDRKGMKLY